MITTTLLTIGVIICLCAYFTNEQNIRFKILLVIGVGVLVFTFGMLCYDAHEDLNRRKWEDRQWEKEKMIPERFK